MDSRATWRMDTKANSVYKTAAAQTSQNNGRLSNWVWYKDQLGMVIGDVRKGVVEKVYLSTDAQSHE